MGLTGRNISQGGIGQRVEISSFRAASAVFNMGCNGPVAWSRLDFYSMGNMARYHYFCS